MVDLKDKIEYVRALIIGLVATLATSTAISIVSGWPVVGKVATINILGPAIVVGILVIITMFIMDKVDMLKV